METFNPQKKQEERFARIKSEVEHMRKNLISKEDFEVDLEREKFLIYKRKDLTETENIEYKEVLDRINNYGVSVKTISEFKYALECLGYYSEKKIQDIVSHENAHANKAEILGSTTKEYRLISFVDKNGKEDDMYFARIGKFPEDWSADQVLIAMKDIAQAPEEYESGQPLSESDKEKRDRANKGLLK